MKMKRLCVSILLAGMMAIPTAAWAGAKWEFWSVQRKGANGFNEKMKDAWFAAAAELGLEFVRIVPDWWKAADRDFLLGNASDYRAINESDYTELMRVLDMAKKHKVKVVFSMASLPGARQRQFNDMKFDYRMWGDGRYQEQAFSFWRELARRLKGHPAVYAYNPLNEPHPARKDGFEGDNVKGFREWYEKKRGTTWDLNLFNRKMVAAIREVDGETPIVLDGWFHAGAEAFHFFEPVDDDKVIYAFHGYGPWNFTAWRVNKGRYAYPDRMPDGWDGKTRKWTKRDLEKGVAPVAAWMKRHNMPPTRVMVGEFGCDRRVEGAREYLADWIAEFNEHGWHWAFYAFREDKWQAMDYELGTGALGWDYWQAKERGEDPEPPRKDNPLFEVIKREFKGPPANR